MRLILDKNEMKRNETKRMNKWKKYRIKIRKWNHFIGKKNRRMKRLINNVCVCVLHARNLCLYIIWVNENKKEWKESKINKWNVNSAKFTWVTEGQQIVLKTNKTKRKKIVNKELIQIDFRNRSQKKSDWHDDYYHWLWWWPNKNSLSK